MAWTTNRPGAVGFDWRRARQLALAVALVVILGTLLWSVASPEILPSTSREVTGIQARLSDDVRPFREQGLDRVRWQTFWSLEWLPVAGATDYVLTIKTSEGVSQQPRYTGETMYRLEVAKGDNPTNAGLLARDIQLSTIQSLLSVSIAPRFPDGSIGRASPYFEVGRTFP